MVAFAGRRPTPATKSHSERRVCHSERSEESNTSLDRLCSILSIPVTILCDVFYIGGGDRTEYDHQDYLSKIIPIL